MIAPLASVSLPEIELQLLVEAVFRYTGFDFREYAPATLKRRATERMRAEDVPSLSALQDLVLHDLDAMERLIFALSANPVPLFSEADFFKMLRTRVAPMLRTFPFVRVWCAGGPCEEAYSVAIVLAEEGVLRRCKVYGTDTSETMINRARSLSVPAADFDSARERYRESGGTGDLADHFTAQGNEMRLHDSLGEHFVFGQHSLATDGSFNEFQLIVSRNVLVHFTKGLAYRAHQLFFESLVRQGYVGFGSRESLLYTPFERCFEPVSEAEKLYRRVR